MQGVAPRWLRDREGATAVEFGLVSLPFLALVGAIFQTIFMVWAQQNLDNVLQSTVRSLLTGQFQVANSGQTNTSILLATLKTNMCGSGNALTNTVFNCSGVYIDVTVNTANNSFAGSTVPVPVDPTTKTWAANFGTHYTCAAPNSIVIATAAIKFPLFFGILNTSLSDFADGSILLQSTSVFRTEPYAVAGTPAC